MKLPFTLALKFVFRILLPGFVITLGLLPVSRTLLARDGSVISLEYLFILEMLLFGWMFVLLDMPIYMVFEGRRYWPKFAWDFFLWLERKRLTRLEEDEERYSRSGDTRRSREASVEARRFPLDDATGVSVAKFPTRLGNLLTAYEEYSKRIYGMYQGFYWPRIWVKLDKDLREEIDSMQALADSALYTVAALYMSGVVCLAYLILYLSGATFIKFLPLPFLCWLLPPACFVLGYALYRASLHTHAQFGETFKTVFDQFRQEVKFEAVLKAVSQLTHDPSLQSASVEEQNMAVWRYLHNYRVKCPRCGDVILPVEAEGHAPPHTQPPAV